MTVVAWHPDELLDKQKRGRLYENERKKLDAHLAGCAACRVEALAMEDFALELDADDDERASGSLSRLVHVAVAEQTPARRRRKLVPVVTAAIALLAASSAAALYTGTKAPERAAPALDAVTLDMERHAATWNQEPKAPAPKEERTEEATPAPAAPSAAALFASANEARRAGRTREALRLYRDLERRHPESPEAKLSHAIVGRMLIDEDPKAALGEFDRYLGEGKGTLSEEALVGRALSLQKLGRQAEERAAWEALLRTYPNSIHAARARARLAALGGG